MTKNLRLAVNKEIERLIAISDFVIEKDKPFEKHQLYKLLAWIGNRLGVPDFFRTFKKEAEYVPEGLFDVEGRYDSGEHRIHITFIFNPNDKGQELKAVNPVVWQYFKGMIFDTISHEVCHFYQDDQRRIRRVTNFQRLVNKSEFKTIIKNDQNETGLYLLNPDEIDAHAYNAASQMYRKYGSLERALGALREGKYCETIDYYREYISSSQRPYKRFIRKVVTFLVDKYSETIADSTSEQSEVDDIDHVDDNKK